MAGELCCANVCVAASTCSAADAGDAGAVDASSGFAISPDNTFAASSAVVAVDLAGRVTTAWIQSNGVGDYAWIRRYEPDAGWADAGTIISLAAPSYSPQVAVSANGTGVVAWIQGSPGRVYASRFGPDGMFVTPFLLDTAVPNDAGSSTNLRIAADRLGSSVVVWERDARIYSNLSIDGGAWGPLSEASDDVPTASTTSPHVALHQTSGEVFVVFTREVGGYRSALVRRSNFASSTWGANAVRIDSQANANVNSPRIGVDRMGNAVVVWDQAAAGLSSRIWYNRYSVAAGVWGDAGVVSIGNEPANAAEIAVDEDGGAIAIWRQDPGDGGVIKWSGYRSNFVMPWSQPLSLSNSASVSDGAQISLAPNGAGAVVWREYNGLDYRIRLALAANSSIPNAVDLSITSAIPETPAVAANPSGVDGVHAVWCVATTITRLAYWAQKK